MILAKKRWVSKERDIKFIVINTPVFSFKICARVTLVKYCLLCYNSKLFGERGENPLRARRRKMRRKKQPYPLPQMGKNHWRKSEKVAAFASSRNIRTKRFMYGCQRIGTLECRRLSSFGMDPSPVLNVFNEKWVFTHR